MEDSKLLELHDDLSKLKKSAGLGLNSQYSWAGSNVANPKPAVTSESRTDGLPKNSLYENFVKAGTYDPNANNHDHGDGRIIKRNFDDMNQVGTDDDTSSSSANLKKTKKISKRARKEAKKATKKAEKLETKRQAKIDEKKRLKKETKKKKLLKGSSSLIIEACDSVVDKTTQKRNKKKEKKRKLKD